MLLTNAFKLLTVWYWLSSTTMVTSSFGVEKKSQPKRPTTLIVRATSNKLTFLSNLLKTPYLNNFTISSLKKTTAINKTIIIKYATKAIPAVRCDLPVNI